ncbi:MAG: ATP-binding protein, partial [Acidimicrobiales bacterium]|nr:ATP-binding protein [Acidimicrobiales bacterium]
RGDEHLVGATPGIGLGLHIVRSLVEAMGGTVAAEANSWRGSTFTVLLPDREDLGIYPSVSGTESTTTA